MRMRGRVWSAVIWHVALTGAATAAAPRAEAQVRAAADSTAVQRARAIVTDINRRIESMRVEARELPGSARENARVMGFVQEQSVRHILVAYTGIMVHGFERFWFRGDSLVQATRIIERLSDPQRQTVVMRVEHQLIFLGDSLLERTTRVTAGSGDGGDAPEGPSMRLRAAGFRRCIQAPPSDTKACRGF